jgi:divalent metal cation (Fe/Co/Zn/Cd) transporter
MALEHDQLAHAPGLGSAPNTTQGPANPLVDLAWSWALIMVGFLLVLETTRLPFTAGSPATDLLAPVSALGCGIVAVMTAWKARRGAKGPWSRAFALLSLVLALMFAAVSVVVLAFIFLMCGNYWARDTC